jgi:hypothetical protein
MAQNATLRIVLKDVVASLCAQRDDLEVLVEALDKHGKPVKGAVVRINGVELP